MLSTEQREVSEKTKWMLSGNAIAGVVGGFTSSLIMHPLDVVTTRMQAQDGRISQFPIYKNPLRALVLIAKTEGFSRLYAGIVPNLVGSTTNWGIYFFGYNYSRNVMRAYIQRKDNSPESKELGPVSNLCCATATGCVSAIVTQPIWLAKTRMELQHGANAQYRGMVHCIVTVVQKEGFRALFRSSPRPEAPRAAALLCRDSSTPDQAASPQCPPPACCPICMSRAAAADGERVWVACRVGVRGSRGLLPSLLLVSHISLHFMAYEAPLPSSPLTLVLLRARKLLLAPHPSLHPPCQGTS